MLFSLSSCLLLDGSELMYQPDNSGDGSPTYNVDGGDNYDVDITLSGQNNIVSASKSVLSVVSVSCGFEKYEYNFYGQPQKKSYASAGSGVIYKLDKAKGEAYVITNYHVVYDENCLNQNKISSSINLYLYGMEDPLYAIPATYVGGSM